MATSIVFISPLNNILNNSFAITERRQINRGTNKNKDRRHQARGARISFFQYGCTTNTPSPPPKTQTKTKPKHPSVVVVFYFQTSRHTNQNTQMTDQIRAIATLAPAMSAIAAIDLGLNLIPRQYR